MTVKQGTIYGFLGANGAGKTAILKMIMGLLIPTSGEITVAGNRRIVEFIENNRKELMVAENNKVG